MAMNLPFYSGHFSNDIGQERHFQNWMLGTPLQQKKNLGECFEWFHGDSTNLPRLFGAPQHMLDFLGES